MSDGTSLCDKNTVDHTQVFPVDTVYRRVIGSVLFAFFLADTGSGQLSDDSALQMIGASIFIISSLIIALVASPSKFTIERGIFSVTMIDVLAITLVADPTTLLTSGFTTLELITVVAATAASN
jgi:hypothetical protein